MHSIISCISVRNFSFSFFFRLCSFILVTSSFISFPHLSFLIFCQEPHFFTSPFIFVTSPGTTLLLQFFTFFYHFLKILLIIRFSLNNFVIFFKLGITSRRPMRPLECILHFFSIPAAAPAVGMNFNFFFRNYTQRSRWDGMWLRIPTALTSTTTAVFGRRWDVVWHGSKYSGWGARCSALPVVPGRWNVLFLTCWDVRSFL